MRHLIVHIPHASTHFPHKEHLLVSDKELEAESLKLTDWYTDELFHTVEGTMVMAPFSRIFCDVERFADDSKEVMASRGMGVLYATMDDGRPLRMVKRRQKRVIIERYYRPHHKALEQSVDKHLKDTGTALIVDAHSFPNKPLKRDLDQRPGRPDFNIGTDPFHTPQAFTGFAEAYFREQGFSLGVNWPYSGVIVPEKHYGKTKAVHAIMLEVNRSLYLEGETNIKSRNFLATRNVVKGFLEGIRSLAL